MQTLFTEGLKDEVQLQMLRDCPENLDELFRMAIDIDGRLYKMRKCLEESSGRKKSDPSSSRSNSNRTPPTQSTSTPYIPPPKRDPNAMEIDSLSVLDANGKLNATEKSRQHKMNLCLYCRCLGHQARACPSKKGKSVIGTVSVAPNLTPGNAVWTWSLYVPCKS